MGTVHRMPNRRQAAAVGQIVSWTYNDLIALRRDVIRQTTELGNAVASSTTLDQATRDEWRAMRQRVVDWLRDDPSWFRSDSQYRRGEALQKDLLPWYERLRSAGSHDLPPTPTQPTKPLISPAGFAGISFEGMGPALLLLALVYAFKK
jgi:hypothetical protein